MTSATDIVSWVGAEQGPRAHVAITVFHMASPLVVAGQLYKLGNQTLRGLTRVMGDRLWHVVKKRGAKTRTPAPLPPGFKRLEPVHRQYSGLARGTKVHEQMADLVKHDILAFHRNHPEGAHNYALRALRTLYNEGILVFRCEVPVFSASRTMATRLDFVGVRRDTGQLVCGELKTGYNDGSFQTGVVDGQWRPGTPMRRAQLPCTAFERAKLQIALGTLMLGEVLAAQEQVRSVIAECVVVHVDDRHVRLHWVPASYLKGVAAQTYQWLGLSEAPPA